MVDLLKRMILNVQQLDLHLLQYCRERGASREWCAGTTTQVADYLADLKFKAASYAKKEIDEDAELEIAQLVVGISDFMNDQYKTLKLDWLTWRVPKIVSGLALFMIVAFDLTVTLLSNKLPELTFRSVFAHLLRLSIALGVQFIDKIDLTKTFGILFLGSIAATYAIQNVNFKHKFKCSPPTTMAVLVIIPMGLYHPASASLTRMPAVFFELTAMAMLTVIYLSGVGAKRRKEATFYYLAAVAISKLAFYYDTGSASDWPYHPVLESMRQFA